MRKGVFLLQQVEVMRCKEYELFDNYLILGYILKFIVQNAEN